MTTKINPSMLDPVLATGSTTARSLGDRHSDVVNVLDYGADPTGSANSTSAFNAAIVAAAGSRRVLVPPGTFVVAGVSVGVAGTTVVGDGFPVLKSPALAAGVGSPILNVTASSVTVRGVVFDGNKAAQPLDGWSDSWAGGPGGTGRAYRAAIKASGVGLADLTVEDCTFQNTFGAGLAALDVSRVKARRNKGRFTCLEPIFIYTSNGWGTFTSGHHVTDNDIQSCGTGQTGGGAVNSNGIVVSMVENSIIARNTVKSVERNGIKVESGRNVLVSENVVDGNSVDSFGGIQLQGQGEAVSIKANTIRNTGAGINLNAVSGAVDWLNISVEGNIISDLLGPGTGDGVSLSGGFGNYSGVTIAGNQIRAPYRYGIFIQPVTSTINRLVIASNTVSSNTSAVYFTTLSGAWTDVSVTGNTLKSTVGAGLYIDGTASKISRFTVTGNVLAGATALNEATAAVSSGQFLGNGTSGSVTFATPANWTQTHQAPMVLGSVLTMGGAQQQTRTVVTGASGAVGAVNATLGNLFVLAVNDTSAMTVPFPTGLTPGQSVTFLVMNLAGAGIAVSWNGGYHLAGAWVNPAAGANRSVTFIANSNSTLLYEASRASADVSN